MPRKTKLRDKFERHETLESNESDSDNSIVLSNLNNLEESVIVDDSNISEELDILDDSNILEELVDIYYSRDSDDVEGELVLSLKEYEQAISPSKCELSSLMMAARCGDELGVLTLSTHLNVNQLSRTGNHTAISLAAREGHEFIVRHLNTLGADKEIGILVPLAAAAIEGRHQIMAFLINNGASVNSLCMNGDTPLSLACEWGQLTSVLYLIHMNAELDPPNVRGFTPLMKACRAGHLQIVNVLIFFGANINATSFENKHSPLSLACRYGHVSVVQKLLASGANIHYRLKDDWTALMEATRFRQAAVVAVLMVIYRGR